MANIVAERLSFLAEWYQSDASIMRQFLLNFYPFDASVELFDRKTNKTFLKRVRAPGITQNNLYIGAKVSVFGRQITVIGYNDNYTQTKITNSRQMTFCIIPSKEQTVISDIVKRLCDNDFCLNDCGMYELSRKQCDELIEMIPRFNDYTGFSDLLSMQSSVAMLISGTDAINRFKQLFEVHAESDIVDSETDSVICATSARIYFTNTADEVVAAKEFFFSDKQRLKLANSLANTTLCIIKPHAVLQKRSGEILADITRKGFTIKAMKMFNLNKNRCEEFYSVYNGIMPSYPQMVIELSSGPSIAIEIAGKCENKHPCQAFRELCGPADPSIARQIRPKTLRATYGANLVQNAVHCTDIEDNCSLEMEYFFTTHNNKTSY